MSDIKKQVQEHYGNRIRVRACGVLIENDKIMMLKHEGIGELNYYWSVPGGEPLLNENLAQAVEREMEEEVNLKVKTQDLLHVNEYINDSLHAIELYFRVIRERGSEKLGIDPESPNFRVLTDLKWFLKTDLLAMNPKTRPDFLEKIWH
ncbi:8-oxo-dGTP diphosphatase [Spirosomataceae bacterium TFI 002]|nr:8-oxo-dGTP diphosphatase [Spirosomataceae bacterium TFI 002]